MEAGAVHIKFAADMAALQTDMQRMQRLVGGALDGVKTAVGRTQAAFAALAGLAGGAVFSNTIRGALDAAAALDDLAQMTGGSVEGLSRLQQVGKVTGTSMDQVGAAMAKLGKSLNAGGEQGAKAQAAIAALGLNMAEFKALRADQQFEVLGQSLSGYADGAEKAAVVQALMGDEAAKLIPYLHDLAGMQDLVSKVTAEQAAAAADLGDNFKHLQVSSSAWADELAHAMAPALNTVVQALTGTLNSTGGLRDQIAKLAADGSIRDWTIGAAKGVSYLADGLHIAMRVLGAVGKALGGVAAAAMQLITGEFRGAAATVGNLWEDLKTTFDGATVGQQFRQQLDQVGSAANQAGQAVQGNKPKLDVSGLAQANAKAIDANAEAWKRINAEVAGSREIAAAWAKTVEGGQKILADTEADTLGLNKAQAELLAYLSSPAYAQHSEAMRDIAVQTLIAASNAIEAKKAKDLEAKAIEGVIAYERELAQQRADHRNAEAAAAAAFQAGVLDAERARADSAVQAALDAEAALAHYGLTRSEVLKLHLAEKQRALDAVDASSDIAAARRREIEALQRQIKATQGIEEKDRVVAATAAAKQAADAELREFERVNQLIEQSLFDAIVSGGKSAAESIKGIFKALILRPIVQAVTSPVTAAITGGLGLSGAANAATSLGASAGTSLLGGMFPEAALFGNQIASSFTTGVSSWFGGAASQTAAFADLGAAVAPSVGGQIGAFLADPITMAIAAGFLLVAGGAFKGETRRGAGYELADGQVRFAGGPSGGAISQTLETQLVQGTIGTINDLLRKVGSAASVSVFGAGLETSEKGRGGVYAGGVLSSGQGFGQLRDTRVGASMTAEQAAAGFTRELKQTTLQALQAAQDIPASLQAMFAGIDIEGLAQPQLDALHSAVVQQITDVGNFRGAIAALPFANLQNLSFDAAEQVLRLSGGIGALAGNLRTYYDNFFTAEEQRAQTVRSITATLNAAGAGLTEADVAGATRETFRALVDGIDTTTEAGARLYAAALGVAGSFAQITQAAPAATQNTQQLSTAVSTYASTASLAADALGRATNAAAGLQGAITGAVDNLLSQYQALVGMATRARQYLTGLETQVVDAAQAVLDAQAESQKRLLDLQRRAATEWRALLDDVGDALDRLNGTDSITTGPADKLQYARDQFAALSAAAAEGDVKAQAKLIAGADKLLTSSRSYATSAVEYARDQAMARIALTQLAEATQLQIDTLPEAATATATLAEEITAAEADLKRFDDAVALMLPDLARLGLSLRDQHTGLDALASAYLSAKNTLLSERDMLKGVMATGLAQIETEGQTIAREFDAALTRFANDAGTLAADLKTLPTELGKFLTGVGEQIKTGQLSVGDGIRALGTGLTLFASTTSSSIATYVAAYQQASSELGAYGVTITTTLGGYTSAIVGAVNAANSAAGAAVSAAAAASAAASAAVTGAAAAAAAAQAAASQAASNPDALRQVVGNAIGNVNSGLQGELAALGNVVEVAQANGYNSAQVAAALNSYGVTNYSGSDVSAFAQSLGLPAFAQGANNIPQDMLALVHQGEAIIPAPFNPERYSRASGNDALVAEIKALRAEVANLRREQGAGLATVATHTRKTREVLDKFDVDGLPATRT